MAPFTPMLVGSSTGSPTQTNLTYYNGEDIYWRTDLSASWSLWTDPVVKCGDGGSPVAGAPYDYVNVEDAIAATSGNLAILQHNVTDNVIVAEMRLGTRTILIKGVGSGSEIPARIRNPNDDMFDFEDASTLVVENMRLHSSENFRSVFALGRNLTNEVYINKSQIYGTGDQYMVDFYKGDQAFKGVFKSWYCRFERAFTTFIDHGDGSGASTAEIRNMWHYNNGNGTYRCYSCGSAPSPLDYTETTSDPAGSGYGYNVGTGDLDYYLIGFGPS